VQWEADIVCSGAVDYTMSRFFDYVSPSQGGGTLEIIERVLGGSFSGTLGGALGSSATSGDVTAVFTAGASAHANPPFQQVTGDLLTISRNYILSRRYIFSPDNTLPAEQRPPDISELETRAMNIRRQCSYPGIGPAGENIFNTVTPADGRVFLRESTSAFTFAIYNQSRNVSLSSVGLCATGITAAYRERIHIEPDYITDPDDFGFAHTFPIFDGYSPEGLAMLAFDFPISVTAVRLVYGGVSVDWYKDSQRVCV
jgi:hypothetical protein